MCRPQKVCYKYLISVTHLSDDFSKWNQAILCVTFFNGHLVRIGYDMKITDQFNGSSNKGMSQWSNTVTIPIKDDIYFPSIHNHPIIHNNTQRTTQTNKFLQTQLYFQKITAILNYPTLVKNQVTTVRYTFFLIHFIICCGIAALILNRTPVHADAVVDGDQDLDS